MTMAADVGAARGKRLGPRPVVVSSVVAAIALVCLAACGSGHHETYAQWRRRSAPSFVRFATLNVDIETALSDIGPGAAAVKCQEGLRSLPPIAKVLEATPDAQLRGLLRHTIESEMSMLHACVKGDTAKAKFYTEQSDQYLQEAVPRVVELSGPTTTINGPPTYPTPTCVANTAGMNCA
jgi:hypothetical protein